MNDGMEFESTIDGKDVKLQILVENLDIERKCDTEYHIAFTQLMKRGILPKATLEKEMQQLDIWSPKDEKSLTELQAKLMQLQITLEQATTHEEGLAVARDMGQLRADCLKLVEAKAAVLSNSCESLADSIRRDAYIAYATVYADTKKRVFRDYQEFLLRSHEPVVFAARELLLAVATDSFQDSLMGLPEITYVREVEEQVTEEAAKAEKAKKAAKKKVTKKKTATKKATKKKAKKRVAKKTTS